MGIMALNTAVFLAWRIRKLQPILITYFCANPFSRNHNLTFIYSPRNNFLLNKTGVVCWPLVLASFSHMSVLHMVGNMLSLHSLSVPVAHSMGKEQFLAFYLSAGVFSSLLNHAVHIARRLPGLGLGAVSIFGIYDFNFKSESKE
jgi:rhomboid-like protein